MNYIFNSIKTRFKNFCDGPTPSSPPLVQVIKIRVQGSCIGEDQGSGLNQVCEVT